MERVSDKKLMDIQSALENNIGYLKGIKDENGIPIVIREMAKILIKLSESNIELIERNLVE